MQFASFFEKQSNDYCDDITIIKDLQKSLAEKNKENRLLDNYKINPSNSLKTLSFIQLNCNSYMILKYWNTFLEMVMLVEILIRSDRKGYCDLQIITVQELLPNFAATNYFRWYSFYLEGTKRLPVTAPDIYMKISPKEDFL